MFGLDDLIKKIDLGEILDKVGLSDNEKKEVGTQAADAIKYRTTKEKARGNSQTMTNLFSTKDNTEDANKVAKKLEGDLAYNLKNKSGMSDGIIDQIKGLVMSKVLTSFTGAAAEKGDKDGNSLMHLFTAGNLLDKFKDGGMMNSLKGKLGGFFK